MQPPAVAAAGLELALLFRRPDEGAHLGRARGDLGHGPKRAETPSGAPIQRAAPHKSRQSFAVKLGTRRGGSLELRPWPGAVCRLPGRTTLPPVLSAAFSAGLSSSRKSRRSHTMETLCPGVRRQRCARVRSLSSGAGSSSSGRGALACCSCDRSRSASSSAACSIAPARSLWRPRAPRFFSLSALYC